MFKKKPIAEQPRARQRVGQQQPSPSTTVFSYHANRAANPDVRNRAAQPTQETRRKPRWFGLAGKLKKVGRAHVMYAFAVLVLAMLLVGLNATPRVEIVGDTTGRLFLQKPIVYQQAAQKLFAASLLNGNKLTVDTNAITLRLQQEFPELRTASISLPVFGRQPILYVQAATPELILATQHDGQFVIDSTGRALGAVSAKTTLPSNPPLPLITDESGISVQVGHVALPLSAAQFIAQTAAQLRAQHIQIATWQLVGGGNELDAQVSGVPYFAKFNLQGTARQQAGSLVATLQYLAAQHIVPGQYVDVRVSGRTYYK